MSNIKYSLSDRWAIIGSSGAGKTELSKQLLWQYAVGTKGQVPIYILDTKLAPHGGDFKRFYQKDVGKLVRGNTPPKYEVPKDGKPFVVWQPESDDLEMFDDFFKGIYLSRSPAVQYVDELSSLTNTAGNKYPRHFDISLKQGRGLFQALIAVTQSASFIPANLLRQATHMIRMHLNSEYDTKKLGHLLGRSADEEPEDDYGFFYRNVSLPMRKAPTVYYRDMQEFFGLDA